MEDVPALAIGCVPRAWWSGSVSTFLSQNVTNILDRLAIRAIETHATNRDAQLRAWHWEIEILRDALADISGNWQILLEYPLIRLGRIIDAVLVTDRAILVIEFKALNSRFTNDARAQAEDYAFDLRDFHAGSRNHVIVPILVAGAGEPSGRNGLFLGPVFRLFMMHCLQRYLNCYMKFWDGFTTAILMLKIGNARLIAPCRQLLKRQEHYMPSTASPIKSARADTGNLSRTTEAILQAVREAKEKREHIILFVTGIPGAGKTLCGLDVIFSSETDGTFLTGTLPMVYVLKAALAQDLSKICF